MGPTEFKAKRMQLWGTQGRAAEALGVGVAAVKHYEHGRRKVPEMAVKLITCLEEAQKIEVVTQ